MVTRRLGFYYSPDDPEGGGIDPAAPVELELQVNDEIDAEIPEETPEEPAAIPADELEEFKAWKAEKSAKPEAEAVPRETVEPEAQVEPEIPDFYELGYEKAYQRAIKEGWDQEKTDRMAENYARLEAAEYHAQQKERQAKVAQEQQAVVALQAAKPQIEEVNLAEIKKNTPGIPDEVASEVAKLHTQQLIEFGLPAFDDGRNDVDPKMRADKVAKANYLQRTSYLKALGLVYEKQLKAEKADADEENAPTRGKPEIVSGGRPANTDGADKEFFAEYEKVHGVKLTKEQKAEMASSWKVAI